MRNTVLDGNYLLDEDIFDSVPEVWKGFWATFPKWKINNKN